MTVALGIIGGYLLGYLAGLAIATGWHRYRTQEAPPGPRATFPDRPIYPGTYQLLDADGRLRYGLLSIFVCAPIADIDGFGLPANMRRWYCARGDLSCPVILAIGAPAIARAQVHRCEECGAYMRERHQAS